MSHFFVKRQCYQFKADCVTVMAGTGELELGSKPADVTAARTRQAESAEELLSSEQSAPSTAWQFCLPQVWPYCHIWAFKVS
jgi:hypothetical protein